MSGPYDSYNQYPQGGYQPQQQQPYGQGPQYGGYNQHQGYPQQSFNAPQGYGPPARQDSFGPPQQGGFQHGQQSYQYGAYDASNPQGHPGYYGGGGYNQQQQPYDQRQGYPSGQEQQQYAPQSSDPNAPNYDPNAPPAAEGERGLLGAAAGAWGGHHFGKNAGHGLLGTVGGAIVGSLLEDKFKDRKHHNSGPGGHSGSGSSWGGFGGKW